MVMNKLMRHAMRRIPGCLGAALAALTLLAGQPALAEGPAWRLVVKPAAAVTHERVLLGEIATPLGEIDAKDWEQLRAIELFKSPPQLAKPMSISKSGLYAALQFHLKDLAANLILPEQLVLQYGGKAYLPEELQAMGFEAVRTEIAAMEGDAEVRDWNVPPYLFVADGERLIAETGGPVHPGRVPVRFTVLGSSGKTVRQFSAGFYLNLWATVPVATRTINPGDGELNAQMVTFARRNLANLRPKIWDGRGGPWRVRGSIGQDQVIYADNLETPPMIKKGDQITVIFEGRNLRISTKGMALHDAKPDGSVQVQNVQSHKQFMAKVVDAKTVAVDSSLR
jgi:flagellar basal body P-ring formation protein FlgA